MTPGGWDDDEGVEPHGATSGSRPTEPVDMRPAAEGASLGDADPGYDLPTVPVPRREPAGPDATTTQKATAGSGRTESAGRGKGRPWRLVRARRDAVPASVRRFNARARQRRWRAAMPWLVAVLLATVVGGAAWAVYGTTLFAVREIRVIGAHMVTDAQVRAAAAIRPGTPLARLDVAAVRDRVATLAPVARAEVGRDWPSTVLITLVERTPVAVSPAGEHAYLLLSADGVAFSTVLARPPGLPLVALATPGPADPATVAALKVLAALPDDLKDRMTRLAADTPAGIRLELAGGRTIIWGDAERNERKATVATRLLREPVKVIDVSAPDLATTR